MAALQILGDLPAGMDINRLLMPGVTVVDERMVAMAAIDTDRADSPRRMRPRRSPAFCRGGGVARPRRAPSLPGGGSCLDPGRACVLGVHEPRRRCQCALPCGADPDFRRHLQARRDRRTAVRISRSALPSSPSVTYCLPHRHRARLRHGRERYRQEGVAAMDFRALRDARPSRLRRCSSCGSASASGRRCWW